MNWKAGVFFLGIAVAVALGVAVGPFLRPYVPTAWLLLRAAAILFAFFFVLAIAKRLVWEPVWRRVYAWMHGTSGDHPWR